MDLPQPERCNCLVWALRMWRRCGGYVLWRWSHYGPWWHFLWMPADRSGMWSYTPINPIAPLDWPNMTWFEIWRKRPRDLLWFEGRVEKEEAR